MIGPQTGTHGVRFEDGLHYRPKGRRIMAEVIADTFHQTQGEGRG